jgi:hypothetical protein
VSASVRREISSGTKLSRPTSSSFYARLENLLAFRALLACSLDVSQLAIFAYLFRPLAFRALDGAPHLYRLRWHEKLPRYGANLLRLSKSAVEENDHIGVEDPECANQLMSAVRYFLTEWSRRMPTQKLGLRLDSPSEQLRALLLRRSG